MPGSPFNRGNSSTAPAAEAPKKAAAARAPRRTADEIPEATNFGDDTPIADDPFDAEPSAPAGIAGYKPGHFMNQLVMLHATEHGTMRTAYSTAEKPKQEFVKFDLIPITLPEEFGFTNKFQEYEACEPFEIGQRLDDLMFFNGPLVREGKRMLDRGIDWILGRIVKGDRKEGQDAPVMVIPATDEDKELYQAYRAKAKAARAAAR